MYLERVAIFKPLYPCLGGTIELETPNNGQKNSPPILFVHPSTVHVLRFIRQVDATFLKRVLTLSLPMSDIGGPA